MTTTKTLEDGTWQTGEVVTDSAARLEDVQEFGVASLPYPEARYWSERTGNKVFLPGVLPKDVPIVDGLGFVITDANGVPIVL